MNGAMAGRGRMLPSCCIKRLARRLVQLRQFLSFKFGCVLFGLFTRKSLAEMFAKRFNLWK